MSILNHHPLEKALNRALDGASGVPDMPFARIEAAALSAFPYKKPLWENWTARIGALAAVIVLGFVGFTTLQTRAAHQQSMQADADAFAAQLLSESF